ncbi:MAG TPA: hypothetical protein VI072_23500 [Polyangiaceae bacterium]
MHPSSVGSHDPVHFDELWSRVARLVPHAAMEDKLFWRRLEGRKAACEQTADPEVAASELTALAATLQRFEARLRERLSVRLALLGDSGQSARPA